MDNKGSLFLIPTAVADDTNGLILTPQVGQTLPLIRHFLAEDVRSARRYLSALKIYDTIEALSFSVLNKDTREQELEELFRPVRAGHHLGVMSESGCPGVADPGALAARYAHRNGIRVVPLVGPSSILLALMASGLNGQQFAFNGYLPVDKADASKAIREFERISLSRNQTQIFIETPYRNNSVLASLLKSLRADTALCVAMDVTGKDEFILTQPVASWRSRPPELARKPAVFLFLAG